MPDLKDLRDKREEILKAELAAWLHDVGKFCNLHVESHTNGPRKWGNGGSYKVVVNNPRGVLRPRQSNNWIRSHLSKRLLQVIQNKYPTFYTEFHNLTSAGPQWEKFLLSNQITIPSLDTFSVAELIMLGLPGASKPTEIQVCFAKHGWLPAALGISHGVAHYDKQDGDGPQTWPDVFISTAFGFENRLKDLDAMIQQLPAFFGQIKQFVLEKLNCGLGDTRRPVNEVTLLDWVWTVSSLYKVSISHAILDQPLPITNRHNHQLRWRLLSIRTNGLEYLLSAPSIPDLKVRQNLLQDAWEKVQDLLEEEYPLALEVYRDENGPVFVVPDIDDLLDLTDSEPNTQTLREFILERFRQGTVQNDPDLALQGEIVPEFFLDKNPWDGQSNLPPIGEHLKKEPALQSDPQWVATQWCNPPKPQERCTVCGLRPQGPSSKALARKVCDVCEQRRDDRAERWVKKSFSSTIWLGEVADAHHRLALIVGRFDLTHWLDGTLVRSLAVRDPKNAPDKTKTENIAKNPSFARLRRIWETTRKFWQGVAPTEDEGSLEESLAGKVIGKNGTRRLQIKGTLSPAQKRGTPGRYHVYEMALPNGIRLSVVWDPEQKRFITADNLAYLAGETQLGKPVEEVLKQGRTFTIQEPVGYGAPDKVWGKITLSEDASEIENSAYTPLIPILAEPRTFMTLVPADKAFEVLKTIKTKYEREMGKVRNRLPLHLGVVFADSHQPLRTILNAGRRMLNQQSPPSEWEVKNLRKQPEEGGTLPERFKDDAQGQFAEWFEIDLEKEGRKITWHVPTVMGDGQTEDHWYPYVFLATSDEPTDRNRYYKTDLGNPWNPDHPWLVHAGELQPGDRIYFTPATFDFQWLAAGTDRFKIAYNDQGQRHDLPRRPYFLDNLETLERIWHTLQKHTSESQIHALVSLIESKREEWQAAPENKAFRQFCRDVLTNLEWRPTPWRQESLDAWVDYAAQGWITDAVEIFHSIMKERASTQEEETYDT